MRIQTALTTIGATALLGISLAGCSSSTDTATSSPATSPATTPSTSPTMLSSYPTALAVVEELQTQGLCDTPGPVMSDGDSAGCQAPMMAVVSGFGGDKGTEEDCATKAARQSQLFREVVLGADWYIPFMPGIEADPQEIAQALGGEVVTVDEWCDTISG